MYCRKHKTDDSINLKRQHEVAREGRQAQEEMQRAMQHATQHEMQDEMQHTASPWVVAGVVAEPHTREMHDSSDADSSPSLPPTCALKREAAPFADAAVAGVVDVGVSLPAAAACSPVLSTCSLPPCSPEASSPDASGASAASSVHAGSGINGHAPKACCKSYSSPEARWVRYCEDRVPEQLYAPATQDAVLEFINFLQHEDKVQAHSLAIYLTAINTLHHELGYVRPALGPRIRMAKRAFIAAKLAKLQGAQRKDKGPFVSLSLLKGDSSVSRDSKDSKEWSDAAVKEEPLKPPALLNCVLGGAFLDHGLEKRWSSQHHYVFKWIRFCMFVVPSRGLPALRTVPATHESILEFVAYLRGEGKVHGCGKAYLSAINQLHRDLGYPKPVVGFVSADVLRCAPQSSPVTLDVRSAGAHVSMPVVVPLDSYSNDGIALEGSNSHHDVTGSNDDDDDVMLDTPSQTSTACAGASGASVQGSSTRDASPSPMPASGLEVSRGVIAVASDGVGGGGDCMMKQLRSALQQTESVRPAWRTWKHRWKFKSAANIVKWIRYCQQVVPSYGLPAQHPVPATAEAVSSYFDYLLQHEQIDGASLEHHLSAIHSLHQCLGYPPPRASSWLAAARVRAPSAADTSNAEAVHRGIRMQGKVVLYTDVASVRDAAAAAAAIGKCAGVHEPEEEREEGREGSTDDSWMSCMDDDMPLRDGLLRRAANCALQVWKSVAT